MPAAAPAKPRGRCESSCFGAGASSTGALIAGSSTWPGKPSCASGVPKRAPPGAAGRHGESHCDRRRVTAAAAPGCGRLAGGGGCDEMALARAAGQAAVPPRYAGAGAAVGLERRLLLAGAVRSGDGPEWRRGPGLLSVSDVWLRVAGAARRPSAAVEPLLVLGHALRRRHPERSVLPGQSADRALLPPLLVWGHGNAGDGPLRAGWEPGLPVGQVPWGQPGGQHPGRGSVDVVGFHGGSAWPPEHGRSGSVAAAGAAAPAAG